MFFGSKKIIGLDIGSNSVKIAELNVGRSDAQIVSFGYLPMPPGVVGNGELSNISAVTEVINALVAQVGTKRRDVCVGMLGTSVIVKKISMPKIEKKLMAQQVKFEAEQYIPFDPAAISLTYHVLVNGGTVETMDVLLVAAQNAMVAQYVQAVKGAGLRLSILDVTGFALANVFEFNYGKVSGKTIALINIGASTTNFVVVYSGEVIFSRDIPFGGVNFTLEIHKELGVTVPEAETLKLSAAAGGEVPEQVHAIINNINDLMAEEIKNSFEFFSASAAGLTITNCFYSGGSTSIPNLIPLISKATGVALEPLNPFARISPASNMSRDYLQQIGPFAAIVLGLALRKVGDN